MNSKSIVKEAKILLTSYHANHHPILHQFFRRCWCSSPTTTELRPAFGRRSFSEGDANYFL